MKRILKIGLHLLQTVGLTIGRVNNFLLMLLSFYLLLLPIGFVRRLLTRTRPAAGWIDRPPLSRSHYEKQY